MFLRKHKIHNFRNFKQGTHFSPEPLVNIIYGENGSGKTSLLESIYLLGTGRSFRTRHHNNLINENVTEYCINSNIQCSNQAYNLSFYRNHSSSSIKVNSNQINASSELAQKFPFVLINYNTFDLLDGGPKYRRKYLDWGLFHVEHPSAKQKLIEYKNCLKNRNALLKKGNTSHKELDFWTIKLAECGEIINDYRKKYLNKIKLVYSTHFNHIPFNREITFSYFKGWTPDQTLLTVLRNNLPKDSKLKTTSAGIHKADFRIHIDNHNITDIISRGQQKILSCFLMLAQGIQHDQEIETSCIYLIDDLTAEIDTKNQQLILKQLLLRKAQCFITCIESDDLLSKLNLQKNYSMFHVKQGVISKIK